MMTARYTLKALTLLVAIALVVSFFSVEADSGTLDPGVLDLAETEACCAHDSDQSMLADDQAPEIPAEEDCCPGNCGSCFLSCCGGPVSLDPPAVVIDLLAVSVSVVSVFGTHLPSGYPGEIDHPPHL